MQAASAPPPCLGLQRRASCLVVARRGPTVRARLRIAKRAQRCYLERSHSSSSRLVQTQAYLSSEYRRRRRELGSHYHLCLRRCPRLQWRLRVRWLSLAQPSEPGSTICYVNTGHRVAAACLVSLFTTSVPNTA
eukprot:20486-Rhodomonas_salina.2